MALQPLGISHIFLKDLLNVKSLDLIEAFQKRIDFPQVFFQLGTKQRRIEQIGSADLVADFTSRYPFLVITRLLGLPRHSEEEVKRWGLAMLDIQNRYDDALQCSREFIAFVDPILQQRRHDPGDDLISTLATTEVEGQRLTDEEIGRLEADGVIGTAPAR